MVKTKFSYFLFLKNVGVIPPEATFEEFLDSDYNLED